jgi:hypothetical protein
MILRISLFALVLLVAAALPTWVLACCALLYAFRYTAYELLFLAALIDSFYGTGGWSVPYYTLVAAAALIFIEWLKPHISLYNDGP